MSSAISSSPPSQVPCRKSWRCFLGSPPSFIIRPSREFGGAAESVRLRRCMSTARLSRRAGSGCFHPSMTAGTWLTSLTIWKRAKACPNQSCHGVHPFCLGRHPLPCLHGMLRVAHGQTPGKHPLLRSCVSHWLANTRDVTSSDGSGSFGRACRALSLDRHSIPILTGNLHILSTDSDHHTQLAGVSWSQ